MAKRAPALLDDPPPVRLGRRGRVLIVLALVLAVPAFEEGKVIVARWMTMMGHPASAHTPVLNLLGGWYSSAWSSAAMRIRPLFHEPPWKFGPMMLVAALWMLALVMLMRGMKR